MTDPGFTAMPDLASRRLGGSVVAASDEFFAEKENLILPGLPRVMSDGWENARRRDDAGDYVEFRLAAAGLISHAEIDTSYFVGNAPGWIRLSATDQPPDGWRELLPKTRVQPDTRHRFRIDDGRPATHVRLDVIPDGGLARVRIYGELTEEALMTATGRWTG